MTLEEMISAVQKKLGIQVDGKAGPQTWTAVYSAIVKPKAAPLEAADLVSEADPASERRIATLQPEVRPMARALIQKAAANGIRIRIISGLRTYAEQDALYAQGRTLPGKIVTNAKGGQSNHNFGIAFDIGVFEGSKYQGESPKYKAVGVLGTELGLEWGGNWKTFADTPHYQLRPAWAAELPEKEMLARLRDRVQAGEAIYA
jgi:peptidoglycan LD-endopeptidase CwlK